MKTVGFPAQMNSSRIPSLDGLRALSISFVFLGHIFMADHAAQQRPVYIRFIRSLLGDGEFGVQIFFVISGFLITWLLLKERNKSGTIDIKAFYIRRAFRILPAYYTLILVMIFLSVLGLISVSGRDLLHVLTFTWIYNFHEWNWYLAHTWSLGVEEQFYIFWPLTLVSLGFRKSRWFAAAVILVVPIARAVFLLPTPKMIHRICFVLFAGRFDILMFGCLAAIIWKSGILREFLQTRIAAPLCYTGGLVAALVASTKLLFPGISENLWFAAFADSIIAFGITMLLLYVTSKPAAAFAQFLNLKPIAWVGVLSYSLYLWQQFFLNPSQTYPVQTLPWNLLGAVCAGAASYYLIEQPMIRLRVSRFSPRPTSQTVVPKSTPEPESETA